MSGTLLTTKLIVGHLSKSWAARFEAPSMRHEPEGEMVLLSA